jgi:hypothetical protein
LLDFSMNRLPLPMLAALLSLAAAGAVSAADQQGAPGAAPPAAAAPATKAPAAKRAAIGSDDEIICKREDEIGSRLGGKKTCMTRRDWRQQSNDAGDAVNNAPRPH